MESTGWSFQNFWILTHKKIGCLIYLFLLLFLFFCSNSFFLQYFFRYGLVWLLRKLREGEFWGFCYWLCRTRKDEWVLDFFYLFHFQCFLHPNRDNLPWEIEKRKKEKSTCKVHWITVAPHQSNWRMKNPCWRKPAMKKKRLRRKHGEHPIFYCSLNSVKNNKNVFKMFSKIKEFENTKNI